MSYASLYDIDFSAKQDFDMRPGDHVTTGINSHPVYQVIAVFEEKAWVKDIDRDWVFATVERRNCKPCNR